MKYELPVYLFILVTDVCVRIGALTPESVASDYFFRDFPPARRIGRAFQGSARKEAAVLYDAMSRVIHGAAKPANTRTVIRQTIDPIERLYAQNAAALSREQSLE